jgi:hypothetical protein
MTNINKWCNRNTHRKTMNVKQNTVVEEEYKKMEDNLTNLMKTKT